MFFIKINFFKKKLLLFFCYFNMLKLKIIFEKLKNFILIYLQAKSTFKSNHYYTLKHLSKCVFAIVIQCAFKKYSSLKNILKYFFIFLILTHKKH
jgi:hypothetical protein